jgi:hypothetical protein
MRARSPSESCRYDTAKARGPASARKLNVAQPVPSQHVADPFLGAIFFQHIFFLLFNDNKKAATRIDETFSCSGH